MNNVVKAQFGTMDNYWMTIVKENGEVDKHSLFGTEEICYRMFRAKIEQDPNTRYAMLTTYDRDRIIGEYHIITGHS